MGKGGHLRKVSTSVNPLDYRYSSLCSRKWILSHVGTPDFPVPSKIQEWLGRATGYWDSVKGYPWLSDIWRGHNVDRMVSTQNLSLESLLVVDSRMDTGRAFPVVLRAMTGKGEGELGNEEELLGSGWKFCHRKSEGWKGERTRSSCALTVPKYCLDYVHCHSSAAFSCALPLVF